MNEFQAPYIDRREAAKSYRPKSGTMSPGLQRAREPYRLKNAVVGLTLAAFAVGVWAYSISAVKQDVFDDVDEEVEALGAAVARSPAAANAAPAQTPPPTLQSTVSASAAAAAAVLSAPGTKTIHVLEEISRAGMPPGGGCPVRGVLPRWERHLPGWLGPRLLDPRTKTLVWGAPPVDNVGRMGKV